MLKRKWWRRHWSRRVLACAVVLCAMGAFVDAAVAATARVTWLPRGTDTVTGYAVYARSAGASYGTVGPIWTGKPTPAADGSLSALVTYTPSGSGTNYFAVVALSSTTGETGLSAELPIGNTNPCRNDRCVTKTSCNFTSLPDGSSCDDALYCNGPEVCAAGACDTSPVRNCADGIACTNDVCDETQDQCTHNGPPGCCAACDTTDPCLATACAQGDCSAPDGAEIEINRIRLLSKRSGIKLAIKGRFVADPAIDPTQTGAILEMRTPDGTVVYSSRVAAASIRAGSAGGRYRFTASHSESDLFGNGLTRLDFRLRDDVWLMTAKAETPELLDAFVEPTLTLVIKLGTSCARRMDMPCSQTSTLSICR